MKKRRIFSGFLALILLCMPMLGAIGVGATEAETVSQESVVQESIEDSDTEITEESGEESAEEESLADESLSSEESEQLPELKADELESSATEEPGEEIDGGEPPTISGFTLSGIVGMEISPVDITITGVAEMLAGKDFVPGTDATAGISRIIVNLPKGIKAIRKSVTEDKTEASYTLQGIPQEAFTGPAEFMEGLSADSEAKFNIKSASTINGFTLSGIVGMEISPVDITITGVAEMLAGKDFVPGTDATAGISKIILNLPKGIKVIRKSVNEDKTEATYTLQGVPLEAFTGPAEFVGALIPDSEAKFEIWNPSTVSDFTVRGLVGMEISPVDVTISGIRDEISDEEFMPGTDATKAVSWIIKNLPKGIKAIRKELSRDRTAATYTLQGIPLEAYTGAVELAKGLEPNPNANFAIGVPGTISDFTLKGVVGSEIDPVDITITAGKAIADREFVPGSDATDSISKIITNLPKGIKAMRKALNDEKTKATYTLYGVPQEAFVGTAELIIFLKPNPNAGFDIQAASATPTPTSKPSAAPTTKPTTPTSKPAVPTAKPVAPATGDGENTGLVLIFAASALAAGGLLFRIKRCK